MEKYEVGICGFMDRVAAGENGQTLRTVTVCRELENHFGADKVKSISSHIWKRQPYRFALQIIELAVKSRNVIIFPDRNGIRVILPMFYFMRKLFHYRLYYNVVGAWLPLFVDSHPMIRRMVADLDGVFVETRTLQNELTKRGITNTVLFKNFKQLECADESEVLRSFEKPYRLCFFSRVTPQKGIEDAIWAVSQLNREMVKYTFDIYGPIDPAYDKEFSALCNTLAPEIRYKGVVDAFSSVKTLKDYYLQIFPTRYQTEGIPGSIVDSFFAGVPVIASEWNSCHDVVDDGETGYVYAFADRDALVDTLERAYAGADEVCRMRKCCLEKSKEYSPKEVIKVILKKLCKEA